MSNPGAAYVTLSLVSGIGHVRLDMLLATFGSAEAALNASQRALESVPGMTRAAATAVRSASIGHGTLAIERAEQLGGVVLSPKDSRFPEALREIPESPPLLFALGRLELLRGPCVAIVGAREHSRYGAEVCRQFSSKLAAAGFVVVSGMARGLDAVAHYGALEGGGGTVGVLGNGLGVVYPAANRDLYDRVSSEGCLITEFPPGERPTAGSFPRRNRLISGLSRVTLVVEAGARSGALVTADCALAQAREVLAVPGPVTSSVSDGCNKLIQQGAKPALTANDVLEEYGIPPGDTPALSLPADLLPNERRALDILALNNDHIDEVAHRMQLSSAETLAIMTSLEIRGLVAQEPGKIFRRTVGS